jgi:hypothetical protein
MLAHSFSTLDAVCVIVFLFALPCIPVAVVLAIWLEWRMPKPQLRRLFAIEDSPGTLAIRSTCWCCRLVATCGVLLTLLALLLIRNGEPDGSSVFDYGLVLCAIGAALLLWIRRLTPST